ncbi:type IV secretion protein Rhs [Massilia sp. CCM 8733]|uniref:Type IV secretion protein Rhs n=1 Tax=Massilia mucilaginosa TaxID=2609282 RepID=A0ABX0P473_9BURK|nr:RHS repeat-associated core domain-containing protein [Massilia mucilaginosa]NHZ93853.1 type IV secretion protein Rhs [Massilia mucilaginosa]
MCPAAARKTDPISHTSTLGMLAKMGGALVVGCALGAALTYGAVLAVGLVMAGPIGWVALLAIGFAISLVLEATGINEKIDEGISDIVDVFIPKSIEGKISTGSGNVDINSLPAARAASPDDEDKIECAKHSSGPPPMIAQGSGNVYINDHPAARKDDMTTCGGTIADGSRDVFIGGGTQKVRDIEDERPWYVAAIGVALGAALAVCGRGRMNLSALKSALPCLAMNIGVSMLGSGVGHIIRTTMGHPVNVITGGKILRETPDFILPGPLPIEWARFYCSHDRRESGLLGVGWSLAHEVQLTVERDEHGAVSALYYCDDQGRSMAFPPVGPGECHYSTAEGYYLICTQLGQYLVQDVAGIYRDFGVPDIDFNGILKLQRLEDRKGNWQAFRYNTAGLLHEINDGCGRRLDIKYDPIHPLRVAEVRLTKGAEGEQAEALVRYRYTAHGELAQVINRSGQAHRQFAYCHGLMTEHAISGGLRCQYEWTGEGTDARVIKHWTDDGEAYLFHYDLARRQTTVTDQINRVYHWTWSDDKQPTAYTDPEGHLWRYEWDENRQLVSLTDPLGAMTRWEYDEHGNLTTMVNALDQIEKTEWHTSMDLPIAEIDAAGNRWTYRYDAHGNLLTITDPEGFETEQFYNSRGLPHTIRDARGGYRHMEWNLRAQMTAYTDCSGKRTDLSYDERGAVIGLRDAMGNATRYSVNTEGQVTEIAKADGSVEQFVYDLRGYLEATIDGNGRQTKYLRNARGHLIRHLNALGRTVDFVYDGAHRLEHLINENGETYRFIYDRNDNTIGEIRLDGVVKRIERDARGLVVAITNATGHSDSLVLTMQRDPLGRLIAKHARGRSAAYRYNQIGELLQAQQYSEHGGPRTVHDNMVFNYSKRGELLSEAGHMGTLTHQYDELGNRSATTLPDGRTINSLYYGSGHLHQINIDGEIISDLERDDLHREITRSQGDLSTRFGYDINHRKTFEQSRHRESQEPVLHKTWHYDASGELTHKRHSRNGETKYLYDPLGRVQSAIASAQSETFHWDAAANLVDNGEHGGHIRYNQLLVFEDKRFEYDVHGRLATKRIGAHTVQTFSYDGENRLRQVDTMRRGVQQLVYFEYDALGRRIRKHDTFGTTCFLWDGMQMLQECRGSQMATYIYEPASHAPLARIDNHVARSNGCAQDNQNLPRRDTMDWQVYYFHNDASGIPEELTSATGNVVWQSEYRTWGNTVRASWTHENQKIPHLPATPAIAQNLRFQGQYFDEETGLHYNTFRYYDPDVGRYINPDPIGIVGGTNLYQYAPNPANWIDPWGWCKNLKWGNPASEPTYGHAFVRHTSKLKPIQLMDRARHKGKQIGQWLDNRVAANFIAETAKKGPGAYEVTLPPGVKGRSFLPDGTEGHLEKPPQPWHHSGSTLLT